MSDTRFGIGASRKAVRWSTLFAATAIIAMACSSPATSASPATSEAPASTAPSATAPASEAPSAAADVRIGYISGGDSDPFVLLVTNGIRRGGQGSRRRAVGVRQ